MKSRIFFQSSELGTCESLFIEVTSISTELLLGFMYLPYGNIVAFEELHHQFFSTYCDVIVVGVPNSNMFDCNKLGPICFRCGLSVLHNSQPTYFDITHGTSSLLDFSLVDDLLKVALSGQMKCPSISLHEMIFLSFHLDIVRYNQYYECRDYSSGD